MAIVACGVKRVFVSFFVIWVVSLCFSYRWAGFLECLCFLCVIVFCVFYASAICNLFGVLSCLWMWKPGADRLRGNQSNKQEEARLPDNVFKQTPRICFEVWGFRIFLGLFGFFKCNQGKKQEEARLPDNVFEQTPRIRFGV